MVVIDSAKALQVFADEQSLRVAYYELDEPRRPHGRRVLLVGEYTPEEIGTASSSPSPTGSSRWPTSPVSPSTGAG